MKYSIIFTTVITLALTSQLVTAGSIGDTYTAGDTLTATKMENIKTAVNGNDGNISTNTTNIGDNTTGIADNTTNIGTNTVGIGANTVGIGANTTAIITNATAIGDNTTGIADNTTGIADNATNIDTKQDLVTGTCPAGQAISVINADGTVSCEGGTGVVSISFKAFTVENQSSQQITAIVPDPATVTNVQANCIYLKQNGSSYGYFLNVATATGASCDLNAGFQLPHNVTLTEFSCTVYDNDITSIISIRANLQRLNLTTGDVETIYSTATSIDSTLIQTLSDTTTSVIGGDVIDNANYVYHIDVNFSATDFSSVGDLVRLYGCRATY